MQAPWNGNKKADAASLALQRIEHSIKQEIGFLHACFSLYLSQEGQV